MKYQNLDGLSANVVDAFEWRDCLLAITSFIVIISYIQLTRNRQIIHKHVVLLMLVFLFLATGIRGLKIEYNEKVQLQEYFPESHNKKNIWNIISSKRALDSKIAFYNYGFVMNVISDIYEKYVDKKSRNIGNIDEILPYINASNYSLSERKQPDNLILILVESLSSYPIDKSFGGIEITPNINNLKRNAIYYPHMLSEAQLGESADGQFIYMTGLLPLKNKITINEIPHSNLIAFPSLIKKHNASYSVRMVIPTGKHIWEQKEMCRKYGIDTLFSREDYNGDVGTWLNDRQLFALAAEKDNVCDTPFVSIILTSSTHSPYNSRIENLEIDFPSDFSEELKNYLANVHYMDACLGEYIKSLKNKNLFDNTMIVIVADHKPNALRLKLKNTMLCADIPLLIINSSSNIAYESEKQIYQTSLFPTLLDLYGMDSSWKGVGKSLFMPDSIENSLFECARKEKEQIISETLLYNNYCF